MIETNDLTSEILKDREIADLLSRDKYIAAEKLIAQRFPAALGIMFKSPQEMIVWLMENEGKILADRYGREWKYVSFTFYFKDLSGEFQEDKISCLHLCATPIHINQPEQPHV